MKRFKMIGLAIMMSTLVLSQAACVQDVISYYKRWHLTTPYFDQHVRGKTTYAQIVERYGKPMKLTREQDYFYGVWKSPYKFLVIELLDGDKVKCHCGHWLYRFTFAKSSQTAIAFRKKMQSLNHCLRRRLQKNPCKGCCQKP